VTPGVYSIQAQAPGFASALAGPITVGPGERRGDVVIDLVPEARLRGTVLRKGANTPFERARVTLRPGAGYGALPEAEVAGGGRFAIDGVPPGPFDLIVEFAPNRKKSFKGFGIASGETKEVHLEVEASGAIRGIVRSGGRPFKRAEVSIKRSGIDEVQLYFETGRDGRFEVSDLPAGEYRVQVGESFFISGNSQPKSVPPRKVNVAPGKVSEIAFDFDSGFPLSGRVTL